MVDFDCHIHCEYPSYGLYMLNRLASRRSWYASYAAAAAYLAFILLGGSPAWCFNGRDLWMFF